MSETKIMNTQQKYPPVNWTEGMKLNKDIFIAQDNASAYNMYRLIASTLHPLRYGLLPGYNFEVTIATDNQNTARVSVISCNALTIGGYPIQIQATEGASATDGNPSTALQIAVGNSNTHYWVVLMVQPFERTPFGAIDPGETPARYPFVKPVYNVLLIENSQLPQYAQHPQALIIGKIIVNGSNIRVDEEYLPPCMSVSASQDLLGLHSELDSFLSGLELSCSQIVQKIYKKSQHNELSELAQFLCDRIMLYLGQAITAFRWLNVHDSPAVMINHIVSLARTIKNTIDLRIGSGKDELMNYLCEWCELSQGELEGLLSNMAQIRYNHNDINENIKSIILFAKTIGKLFTTLSSLEFIGKKKESGLFVKEEISTNFSTQAEQAKPKRRFFG